MRNTQAKHLKHLAQRHARQKGYGDWKRIYRFLKRLWVTTPHKDRKTIGL